MTYYGNKLTLSLVVLLTTCTPFAAPLVWTRTVSVAEVGLLAEANATLRALMLKSMMLLTMIDCCCLLSVCCADRIMEMMLYREKVVLDLSFP